jgi:hypothetical protein
LVFKKILVANRGEIAIRAFRAAYELGAKTVAVFPWEDRGSMHREKADEAYQIGVEGHPVHAYLDVTEIIRVAKHAGADAIYPGYGFLSENPELAEAAAANGITFIGPPAAVLEMAGNKVTAKQHAIEAGVPVLSSSDASDDIDYLIAEADRIGFPIFAKAVAGGGGRGMRVIEHEGELAASLQASRREALAAGAGATTPIGDAVCAGRVPRHPHEEGAVVSVVGGPPVLRIGHDRFDIGLEFVDVDGRHRGGVIEIGIHRIVLGGVLHQHLEIDLVGPPVAVAAPLYRRPEPHRAAARVFLSH